MRPQIITRLALSTSLLALAHAHAATLSISPSPPSVDGGDVALLTGSSDFGGDPGHIWSNRPAQGQVFVTGNNPDGYLLDALTLQNLTNNTSGQFTVRVSLWDNRTLTTIASETTNIAAYSPGNFITANLNSPIQLAPNSIYAFDFGAPGSSGFVTANNPDPNSLSLGFAYSSGVNGLGAATLTPRSGDRVFHANLNQGGGLPSGASLSSYGTVSASSSPPAVDGADIANLTGSTDIGGAQGHIWFNRPAQGQSFTTSNHTAGYLLNAITLQNLSNSVPSSGLFTVQVGTLSGTTLTPLSIGAALFPTSYSPGDYITFRFADPVYLDPNQLYGFDWGTTGSGFVTANSADIFLGGGAYSSGLNNSPDNSNLLFHNADRVFHLDLRLAPEPARAMLLALGLLLPLTRRSRPRPL